MKKVILAIFVLSVGFESHAQQKRKYSPSQVPKMPRLTEPTGGSSFKYDISASSGTYNGAQYTEINLGLNWQLSDWLVWRNAAFNRFGSGMNSITGLDTSMRIGNNVASDDGGLGMEFFIGPGYRFASNDASALFAEAGLGFKIAGIYLGVGAKSLQYVKTREEDGRELPKGDTQIFFVIGGGGSL
jgi:hypothetical protein